MSRLYFAVALVLLVALPVVSALCRGYVPVPYQNTCNADQTIANEGECLCCYYDTKGIPTIGIGFNLQRPDASKVMSQYGLKLADVLQDCERQTSNHCLTDKDAKDIFYKITYPPSVDCAESYAPGLPPVKREAIIDMAFNMGCATLKQFRQMQTALKERDWEKAAAQAKNSRWCHQVGRRCDRNAACIAGT